MARQIFCLLFVRMTGTYLQHDLQHELQHDLKKLKNHRLFEPSVQSIIGAVDNRAAAVAALLGIQRSPRGRQDLGRTGSAHYTHTRNMPLPCPVQRQAFGGERDGLGASLVNPEVNRELSQAPKPCKSSI